MKIISQDSNRMVVCEDNKVMRMFFGAFLLAGFYFIYKVVSGQLGDYFGAVLFFVMPMAGLMFFAPVTVMTIDRQQNAVLHSHKHPLRAADETRYELSDISGIWFARLRGDHRGMRRVLFRVRDANVGFTLHSFGIFRAETMHTVVSEMQKFMNIGGDPR
ncbi:hypothetical protein GCM10008927_19280 [Amylibacter ulvae]|uniref:YcxB-like protein domain-containing protein n=1 Tax=Paramylibacter ulvae TaxID=1651968 RepID=A0ABQ3D5A2_9RHOB|nr:hypothetical protein [Amylibacter ulvae]GHA53578.1 hypothetical protein GCM10008927_19280 [Amylibacter ulvae]